MNGDKLTVLFQGRDVGTLSETPDHRVAFAYTETWLKDGFPISPFSLPVRADVFVPGNMHFDGLFGVFADSLPDAWGQLLMNRMLRHHGKDPAQVGQLERLAIIGASGMGAMTYQPAWESRKQDSMDDLDQMASDCQRVLNHEEVGDADTLFAMAGSSGGARPKIMTDEWIIKFPASTEDIESGTMEKAYMDCARDCSIHVPESKLIPSKRCHGYFAVRRFDRDRQADGSLRRVHMITAAAILELDWRTPGLDYHTLMKLTKILCRDRAEEVEQMFRRMCFNVFAHNRDDHAKNFSFVYDETKDRWHLSPAYDLTWSTTYYGEHTTTVDGNGRNPDMKEILTVGTGAGLTSGKCKKIAEEIREKAGRLVMCYGEGRLANERRKC